jgi:hypothetical protein
MLGVLESVVGHAVITKVIVPKAAVMFHGVLAAKAAAAGHVTLATHSALATKAVTLAPEGVTAVSHALGSASSHAVLSSLGPWASLAHPVATSTLHHAAAGAIDLADLGADLLEILGLVGAGILTLRSGREVVEAARLLHKGDRTGAKKALERAAKGGRPLKALGPDWHVILDKLRPADSVIH